MSQQEDEVTVCYFHRECFVLFLWIGICQIDSAQDWLSHTAEQLPYCRSHSHSAGRNLFFIALISRRSLLLRENPVWFAGENHGTEVRVLLDAEQLGLVVTLKPFNISATPPVWNSVCMCALWEELVSSRVGGSRCRNVLTAPGWTGPFTPPLVDRGGQGGVLWRLLECIHGCVSGFQLTVCALCFDIHFVPIIYDHRCAQATDQKPTVCLRVGVCVTFISYIHLNIIAHTAVEQKSRRPPLTWGPDMVF